MSEPVSITRTVDDAPFLEHTAQLRREIGDGFIRNSSGGAVARRLFSIPLEEAAMLKSLRDPDWMEWWGTKSKTAMARLIARYPHWVACEGGGVL